MMKTKAVMLWILAALVVAAGFFINRFFSFTEGEQAVLFLATTILTIPIFIELFKELNQ